jgi:hypothetical protein
LVAGPATAAHASTTASADKPAGAAVATQGKSDNGQSQGKSDNGQSQGKSDNGQSQDKLPSSKVTNYAYEAQPNFFYCGPAATRIAATAQGHMPSQDEVAKELGTTENGTNSAEDTTRVLNSLDGKADYKTVSIPGQQASQDEIDRLKSDVVSAIGADKPVVANIIGTAVDTDGGVHSYEGGHYLTVVGYRDDGQTVKIADPAETNGDGTYWMTTSTLADWIASRGYSA